VKTLQSALNLWSGWRGSRLAPDGFFGLRTNRKVREHQSAHQVAVTVEIEGRPAHDLVDERRTARRCLRLPYARATFDAWRVVAGISL
jgi:peptidoglycan hydrolase-like protein with peptidoglycan-binding domain